MRLISGVAMMLLAVAPAVMAAAPAKPTIVLVHGAFETSDAWDRVIPNLNRDGYKVINIDLPGRRGNDVPMNMVSLALYQRTVAKAIAGERHPVVLVGHSFGGFTISAEAEAQPAKVKTLVYVAAYIPKSGDTLVSMATADKGSKLAPLLVIDKEKGYASVSPEAGGALFGSDATPLVQSMIASGVVREPLTPLVTPISLTPDRFGKIDKVSIRTLRDDVVSTAFQAEMDRATPVRLQLKINTGHAPFVTQPDALAAAIERAAS